jgi:hypothetical protein
LEIIIAFLVGFITTWFFLKSDETTISSRSCPNKEVMVKLAEDHGCTKKMMREIREYSLVKIQDGHYEYAEVLNVLRKKDIHDKV